MSYHGDESLKPEDKLLVIENFIAAAEEKSPQP